MVTMIMRYCSTRTSKALYIKFQNLQGPILFSRTFQVLENGYFFKDFQGHVATLISDKWYPENKTSITTNAHYICFQN